MGHFYFIWGGWIRQSLAHGEYEIKSAVAEYITMMNKSFPKAGGVILSGDFLNPPDRQISLTAYFFVFSKKIKIIFIEYQNKCAMNKSI
ncbi:MAG: hypothetical protein J6Q44_02850 [Alphaproteobacteria bacterium]|nr:hypothetical protein [Alphaproteobacteria bacterium]